MTMTPDQIADLRKLCDGEHLTGPCCELAILRSARRPHPAPCTGVGRSVRRFYVDDVRALLDLAGEALRLRAAETERAAAIAKLDEAATAVTRDRDTQADRLAQMADWFDQDIETMDDDDKRATTHEAAVACRAGALALASRPFCAYCGATGEPMPEHIARCEKRPEHAEIVRLRERVAVLEAALRDIYDNGGRTLPGFDAGDCGDVPPRLKRCADWECNGDADRMALREELRAGCGCCDRAMERARRVVVDGDTSALDGVKREARAAALREAAEVLDGMERAEMASMRGHQSAKNARGERKADECWRSAEAYRMAAHAILGLADRAESATTIRDESQATAHAVSRKEATNA